MFVQIYKVNAKKIAEKIEKQFGVKIEKDTLSDYSICKKENFENISELLLQFKNFLQDICFLGDITFFDISFYYNIFLKHIEFLTVGKEKRFKLRCKTKIKIKKV